MIAILGGGSSLKTTDISRLKGRCDIIAVNDAWKLCPWANIMYAADAKWWRYYDFVPEFRGEKVTQSIGPRGWASEAERRGLTVIPAKMGMDLSFEPGFIHTGHNSGFQALNLAIRFGYTKILLLGFDCWGRHWFGDHPPELHRDSPYSIFRQAFNNAARQLAGSNVTVINCSQQSTIGGFPKMIVEEALKQ